MASDEGWYACDKADSGTVLENRFLGDFAVTVLVVVGSGVGAITVNVVVVVVVVDDDDDEDDVVVSPVVDGSTIIRTVLIIHMWQ